MSIHSDLVEQNLRIFEEQGLGAVSYKITVDAIYKEKERVSRH